MPLELSLPTLALSGAILTAFSALAYRFRPRIAVRTHREKHHGIGVREIAVSVSRPFARRLPASNAAQPGGFEFVIYLTLKSCNQ
jgi:hypothetical protein